MSKKFKLACVLFDLDGTLVDTAPDLIACLNNALHIHQLNTNDTDSLRPFISYGAAAMIKAAVKEDVPESILADVLVTMLDLYQRNIAIYSKLFNGIAETLELIERKNIKWGVVTNKRERFTLPLMASLNLTHRAACIVSGDTTAYAKPHPEPMRLASAQVGVDPRECIYIGDAHHDIVAGNAVQMQTLVALYGYLKPTDKPENWGANALISSPQQLTSWIDSILCH